MIKAPPSCGGSRKSKRAGSCQPGLLLLTHEAETLDRRIGFLFRQLFSLGSNAEPIPIGIAEEERAGRHTRPRARLHLHIPFLPEGGSVSLGNIRVGVRFVVEFCS